MTEGAKHKVRLEEVDVGGGSSMKQLHGFESAPGRIGQHNPWHEAAGVHSAGKSA